MLKQLDHASRTVIRGLLQPLRWLRFPVPETIYQHLYFRGPFTVKVDATKSFAMVARESAVENSLYWRGVCGHESESMRVWLELASRARCVYDIGANTGEYALVAKCVSRGGIVVAFEPVATICDMLRTNVALNQFDIRAVNAAVSLKPGKLPLFDPGGHDGLSYSASLEADFLPGDKARVMVDVVSVDSFSNANGLQPDLVKIDVEGHEAGVVMGAEKTLRSARPVCIVEWLGTTEGHRDAVALLESLDYAIMDTSLNAVQQSAQKASYVERNILLVPREKLDWLWSMRKG
ncbi:MAG TPA: FkbM family methyltransferase [Rhodanobacteraceae bacterium]|nr:FkbM family methyltransferase [Rhodanobacteraceae bacterium]